MENRFNSGQSHKIPLTLVFVNGPANRHNPPKPQLCRKCNCCCDASSVASMFWIILWMAFKMAWSLDIDRTLLIFWSSNEWLQKWTEKSVETNSRIQKIYSIYKLIHLHNRENTRKYNRPFGQILIQNACFILVRCIFDKRSKHSQY